MAFSPRASSLVPPAFLSNFDSFSSSSSLPPAAGYPLYETDADLLDSFFSPPSPLSTHKPLEPPSASAPPPSFPSHTSPAYVSLPVSSAAFSSTSAPSSSSSSSSSSCCSSSSSSSSSSPSSSAPVFSSCSCAPSSSSAASSLSCPSSSSSSSLPSVPTPSGAWQPAVAFSSWTSPLLPQVNEDCEVRLAAQTRPWGVESSRLAAEDDSAFDFSAARGLWTGATPRSLHESEAPAEAAELQGCEDENQGCPRRAEEVDRHDEVASPSARVCSQMGAGHASICGALQAAPQPWKNLRILNLHCNRLTSLAGIESLQLLEELVASANEIRRLEGLRGLKKLRVLDLSANKLSDVVGLCGLTSLVCLALAFNRIETLDGFQHIWGPGYRLERLDLRGNCVGDFRQLLHLAGLHALRRLRLGDGEDAAAAFLGRLPASEDARRRALLAGGNRICFGRRYRECVFFSCPSLSHLDGREGREARRAEGPSEEAVLADSLGVAGGPIDLAVEQLALENALRLVEPDAARNSPASGSPSFSCEGAGDVPRQLRAVQAPGGNRVENSRPPASVSAPARCERAPETAKRRSEEEEARAALRRSLPLPCMRQKQKLQGPSETVQEASSSASSSSASAACARSASASRGGWAETQLNAERRADARDADASASGPAKLQEGGADSDARGVEISKETGRRAEDRDEERAEDGRAPEGPLAPFPVDVASLSHALHSLSLAAAATTASTPPALLSALLAALSLHQLPLSPASAPGALPRIPAASAQSSLDARAATADERLRLSMQLLLPVLQSEETLPALFALFQRAACAGSRCGEGHGLAPRSTGDAAQERLRRASEPRRSRRLDGCMRRARDRGASGRPRRGSAEAEGDSRDEGVKTDAEARPSTVVEEDASRMSRAKPHREQDGGGDASCFEEECRGRQRRKRDAALLAGLARIEAELEKKDKERKALNLALEETRAALRDANAALLRKEEENRENRALCSQTRRIDSSESPDRSGAAAESPSSQGRWARSPESRSRRRTRRMQSAWAERARNFKPARGRASSVTQPRCAVSDATSGFNRPRSESCPACNIDIEVLQAAGVSAGDATACRLPLSLLTASEWGEAGESLSQEREQGEGAWRAGCGESQKERRRREKAPVRTVDRMQQTEETQATRSEWMERLQAAEESARTFALQLQRSKQDALEKEKLETEVAALRARHQGLQCTYTALEERLREKEREEDARRQAKDEEDKLRERDRKEVAARAAHAEARQESLEKEAESLREALRDARRDAEKAKERTDKRTRSLMEKHEKEKTTREQEFRKQLRQLEDAFKETLQQCRREHLAAEDAFRARFREREREEEKTLQMLRDEKRTTDEQERLLRAAARQEEEANRAIQKLADKLEEASRETQALCREKERLADRLAHAQSESARDDEELRQARVLLQQLRGDFQTFRETCVSRERFELSEKARDQAERQLIGVKARDAQHEETAKALREAREKEKRVADALREANLTLSLKEKMFRTQEEQLDNLRNQLKTKEEALEEMAARLKKKEKDTEKKLQEYADRAHDWRGKYEEEVAPLRRALEEREKTFEELHSAHAELERKFLSQQAALEYAQEELQALTASVAEKREREKAELERVWRLEHEEATRALAGQLKAAEETVLRLRAEAREREREGERLRERLEETKKKKKERDMEMRILLELEEKKKAHAAETVKQMDGLLRQLEKECSGKRTAK
ncbi:hypothetical protein BESB_028020 [Besnoitia besnoiti]|uniref:Leucine rich repeat-containing protein n=1 Tax=Besnoitia besnoiti TaxID=94643 RepID=A0A2A9M6W5_BESBE|nr:uncharacterized protein BESB_028020 [Besnoitia besnoiti]PFH31367.1 hypothetical protein BESB_028020 [Besnoitia besnoiti]